jgi:hypothetical protein
MITLLLARATSATPLIGWAGNWRITASRVDLSGEIYEPAEPFFLNLSPTGPDSASGTLINVGRSLVPFASVAIGSLSSQTLTFNITANDQRVGALSGTLDFQVGGNPTAVGNVRGHDYSLKIVGETEIEATIVKENQKLTVYRAVNLSEKPAGSIWPKVALVWVCVILFTTVVTVRLAQVAEEESKVTQKEKTN